MSDDAMYVPPRFELVIDANGGLHVRIDGKDMSSMVKEVKVEVGYSGAAAVEVKFAAPIIRRIQ